MAEYIATKIMHCGDEITLGGGSSDGGQYLSTATVSGSGTIARPYGAEVAIITGHGTGCCYGTVQLLPSDNSTARVGCVSATNSNGQISYSNASKISFFGNSGYSGKTGYVDVLVVGGGAGGMACGRGGGTGGGGGGVIECMCYPIHNLGYTVMVGKGGAGQCYRDGYTTHRCCGCTSSFGSLSASGGNYCSGFPCGCANGGGSGGGSRGAGTAAVCCGYCSGWHSSSSACILVCCNGDGGAGYCSSISGETHAYGGGGGAGGGGFSISSYTDQCQGYCFPGKGCDGGGDGGASAGCYTKADCICPVSLGCDATYYGGGGGGGNTVCGGAGCQGIVIIRYPTDGSYKIKNTSTGGCITTCNINGVEYRIHTFTNIDGIEYFCPVY